MSDYPPEPEPEPGAEPEFDLSTREGKIAWCKHRAGQQSWEHSVTSMLQDMDLMGIPLSTDAVMLGTLEMVGRGEAGARDWLDSIQ